jgi:hypothetical protein
MCEGQKELCYMYQTEAPVAPFWIRIGADRVRHQQRRFSASYNLRFTASHFLYLKFLAIMLYSPEYVGPMF